METRWHRPVTGLSRRRLRPAVGGRRLYAEWLAPAGADPAAPPLVFLHEGLGSVAQWTGRGVDVPAALAGATGRCAVVYDRLGFGRSDALPAPRTPSYHLAEAWEALPRLLDALRLDQVLPIGHSDGATIALLFAARLPERCAALVAEAPHAVLEDKTLAGIAEARAAFRARNSRLRASLRNYHGDKTDTLFANWADVWLDPAFAGFDIRGHLPGIGCPVLALQGERDEFAGPGQLAAIEAAVEGPCETWLVPGCRHVPHFQATERVLERIARFVNAARPEAPARGGPSRGVAAYAER